MVGTDSLGIYEEKTSKFMEIWLTVLFKRRPGLQKEIENSSGSPGGSMLTSRDLEAVAELIRTSEGLKGFEPFFEGSVTFYQRFSVLRLRGGFDGKVDMGDVYGACFIRLADGKWKFIETYKEPRLGSPM